MNTHDRQRRAGMPLWMRQFNAARAAGKPLGDLVFMSLDSSMTREGAGAELARDAGVAAGTTLVLALPLDLARKALDRLAQDLGNTLRDERPPLAITVAREDTGAISTEISDVTLPPGSLN